MPLDFPTEIHSRLNPKAKNYRFPHEALVRSSSNTRATRLNGIVTTIEKYLCRKESSDENFSSRFDFGTAYFTLATLKTLLDFNTNTPQIKMSPNGYLRITWSNSSRSLELNILQPNNVIAHWQNLEIGEKYKLHLSNDFSQVIKLLESINP